ncbi:DUF2842 domain-containing protein [Pararhodobacter oceanensis]|uniref:DUF2842 domain-containing protein n=1 Tax=Pararhodobacter oceanensis TaxID=2172121 RepID=A0A2T8HYI7_9RHOB|nr:DUF2842 domain-containing protein [Pararhodobacter oceanensis]PVH30496.1 DUF2842 domain-containing protein [Pararhodobacter oceanensis]
MALSHKARKRWTLLALCVGMPLYIVAAVTLVGWLPRMHVLVELLLYVVLGIVWIFPLKPLIRGVGKPDPEAEVEE